MMKSTSRKGSALIAALLLILFASPASRARAVDTGRIDTRARAQISGEASNDMLGMSVAMVGDVNGDGYADALLGAPGNETTDPGKAFFVPGGPGGWGLQKPGSQLPNLKYTGVGPEQAASSVSGAGDVNGDGFDDFLIGAPLNDDIGADAGAVYLVLGSASPTGGVLTSISNVVKYTGEASSDKAGTSVSGGGDVNNDGFDDFIVGAPNNDAVPSDGGAAYLVLGSATPLGGSLSSAIKYTGFASGDLAGTSVAVIDDYEGDGFDDLMVGAPGSNSATGSAYIVEGSATPPGGQLGAAGVAIRFNGEAAGQQAGTAVSGAGDVNGDGTNDFLIGAPLNDDAGADAGAVYFFQGRNGAFAPGGTVNLISPPTGAGMVQFSGEAAGDQAGSSLSPAGDVNGDGFDDFLAGAPFFGSLDNGAAYLVYGDGDLLLTLSTVQVSLSTAVKLTGQLNSDSLTGGPAGTTTTGVAGGQDINGDGISDLVVGAAGNDTVLSAAGSAYLIFGDDPALDNPSYRQRFNMPSANHRPIRFEPAGVRVDLSSTASSFGGISVERHQFHPCTRQLRLSTPIWTIESPKLGASATVDLRFKYTNAAIQGQNEAALKLWTRPIGDPCADWTLVSGSTVDAAHNRISVTGLTALGEYTIAETTPPSTLFLPLVIKPDGILSFMIEKPVLGYSFVGLLILVPTLGMWLWRRRAGRSRQGSI